MLGSGASPIPTISHSVCPYHRQCSLVHRPVGPMLFQGFGMAASRIRARVDDRDGSTNRLWSRRETLYRLAAPRQATTSVWRRLRLLTLLLFAVAPATVWARSPEGSFGSPPAAVPGAAYGYGAPSPVPEADRYFVPPSPLPPQYERPPQLQTRPGEAFPDPPRAYPTPPRHYPTPPRAWPQNNHRSSRP